MHPITIVGLGLFEEDMTDRIKAILRSPARVVFRTERCGAAGWMNEQGIAYRTFDAFFDKAEDFDRLNDMILEEIGRLAEAETIVYGVFDLRDRSVGRILEAFGEVVRLVPGVPVDGALAALAFEPACILAASDYERYQPSSDQAALIREIDSRELASEIKLRLMERYPEEEAIYVSYGAAYHTVPLCDLDRLKRYDHHLCALVPAVRDVTKLERFGYDQLNAIVRRLRGPGGCPWDIRQTHESLRTNAVEEAYEVLDAIDRGDMDALYDELGDLLLQVALHSEIARQHGEFTSDDVTSAVCAKMILRHPHIFGNREAATADDVLTLWEEVKKKEKKLSTQAEAMRAVTQGLPALMRAEKVQKKAADVGFDWDSAQDALGKVSEEAQELREAIRTNTNIDEELGDLLFATVNVARLLKVEPELALSRATQKFISRFEETERLILADGQNMKDMTLAEMDVYWDSVKANQCKK